MKDNDDNIQFETMPDWGGITLGSNDKSKEKLKPITLSHTEKEYTSLYEELKDKCNPKNFMEPFELESFKAANDIYAHLLDLSKNNENEIISLRNRAIKQLGISISSTKKKFEELKSFFNPEIFLNRKPYNKEKIDEAGELYNMVLKNADDIITLEDIEQNAQKFFQEEESYYYKNHTIEEYLEKYPDGTYAKKLREKLEKEKKEAEDKAGFGPEDECFWFESAERYLKVYPNGEYATEARYYLEHSESEYLDEYPTGRYVN